MTFRQKFTVGVLLPTCNEAEVIAEVVENYIQTLSEIRYEFMIHIEDANSSDGTKEILGELKKKYPTVLQVYFHPVRDGFKSALQRLLANATEDWLFIADSDGQYFERDIIRHLEKVRMGYDFVKGIKTKRADSYLRKFLSLALTKYLICRTGLVNLDFNSSHYMIKRDLAKRFLTNELKFKYSINVEITLLAYLSEAKCAVVEIRHKPRTEGFSRGNPPLKIVSYGVQTVLDFERFFNAFKKSKS